MQIKKSDSRVVAVGLGWIMSARRRLEASIPWRGSSLPEEARESARRLLRMQAAEALLLNDRLVVVDVVAVLVAETAVIAVGAPLQRDGQRDRQHHGQHHQYYYQRYHV